MLIHRAGHRRTPDKPRERGLHSVAKQRRPLSASEPHPGVSGVVDRLGANLRRDGLSDRLRAGQGAHREHTWHARGSDDLPREFAPRVTSEQHAHRVMGVKAAVINTSNADHRGRKILGDYEIVVGGPVAGGGSWGNDNPTDHVEPGRGSQEIRIEIPISGQDPRPTDLLQHHRNLLQHRQVNVVKASGVLQVHGAGMQPAFQDRANPGKLEPVLEPVGNGPIGLCANADAPGGGHHASARAELGRGAHRR